ncbi:MAG: elongation factor P [Calditrichaeota bacterium]|nr:MAG: elongation factor P [Calditrichota bacterium]MBL1204430.1 elongation factor P [Calditrichota bacterium]NOG44259.1 elongation factor P [Calditrichota bacterium]
MKIKATQIRKGMILIYNNELHVVTGMQHFTPGKGQAGVQTKMKNIKTGNNAENRFRSDENVEKANLDTRKMEFLYDDGDNFYFMDQETYDQIPINSEMIGDAKYYLLPNTQCDISFFEENPLSVELPATMDLKIVETAPHLKTATVTSSYKPAKLETGLTVQVPQFIGEDEVIRIDTRDGKYLERAK